MYSHCNCHFERNLVKSVKQVVYVVDLNEQNKLGSSRWFKPVHVVPFPLYPEMQLQINEPSVFVQFALLLQSWVPRVHSSESENNITLYNNWVFEDCCRQFWYSQHTIGITAITNQMSGLSTINPLINYLGLRNSRNNELLLVPFRYIFLVAFKVT